MVIKDTYKKCVVKEARDLSSSEESPADVATAALAACASKIEAFKAAAQVDIKRQRPDLGEVNTFTIAQRAGEIVSTEARDNAILQVVRLRATARP